MTDQLLAELRKMRSTRTNLGLLAGMVALILLTVLLRDSSRSPTNSQRMTTSTHSFRRVRPRRSSPR